MAIDLQALTDAWGDWRAQTKNTSKRFTSSTKYADHPELANYTSNQCQANYLSISYSQPVISGGPNVAAPTQNYTNDTSVSQSQTLSWIQAVTNTFTWSVTEALKIGVSVSGGASIPVIADGKVTASVELSLSSTQGGTLTGNQQWSDGNPIVVPPKTEAICQSVIQTATSEQDFTALSLIKGCVAIWFEDQVDGHWLWFYPLGDVLQDTKNNNLIDTSGYIFKDDYTIYATTYGTCAGDYGLNIVTNIKEYPLNDDGSVNASSPPLIRVSKGELPASAFESVR